MQLAASSPHQVLPNRAVVNRRGACDKTFHGPSLHIRSYTKDNQPAKQLAIKYPICGLDFDTHRRLIEHCSVQKCCMPS